MTTNTVITVANSQSESYVTPFLKFTGDPETNIQELGQFVSGFLASRTLPSEVSVNVACAAATGTLTITSTGPTNGETFTVGNVTFTAKTSGATGNQFNISATPSVVAANIVAAVNASTNCAGLVTASHVSGVVTFTAAVPGAIGNGIELSAGNLANTTATAFASGEDGTLTTIDLL